MPILTMPPVLAAARNRQSTPVVGPNTPILPPRPNSGPYSPWGSQGFSPYNDFSGTPGGFSPYNDFSGTPGAPQQTRIDPAIARQAYNPTSAQPTPAPATAPRATPPFSTGFGVPWNPSHFLANSPGSIYAGHYFGNVMSGPRGEWRMPETPSALTSLMESVIPPVEMFTTNAGPAPYMEAPAAPATTTPATTTPAATTPAPTTPATTTPATTTPATTTPTTGTDISSQYPGASATAPAGETPPFVDPYTQPAATTPPTTPTNVPGDRYDVASDFFSGRARNFPTYELPMSTASYDAIHRGAASYDPRTDPWNRAYNWQYDPLLSPGALDMASGMDMFGEYFWDPARAMWSYRDTRMDDMYYGG